MPSSKKEYYQAAAKHETWVKNTLMKIGYRVEESTKHQDIHQDIDCFIDNMSVSIKQQDTAAKTGNLCFEVEVFYEPKQEWQKSTWHKPKDVWVITVKDSIYFIRDCDLKSYVAEKGWCKYKNLSWKTKQKQRSIGHVHTDARLGLINLQKLIDAGIARTVEQL